ncbi:unnamed protein product [marine sediment metagenome]|uniref:Uncharacterized protein n=1 Tax=marine sediment metagenome TaxID=412755 RepID=X1C0R6_9ZZZZ
MRGDIIMMSVCLGYGALVSFPFNGIPFFPKLIISWIPWVFAFVVVIIIDALGKKGER